MNGQDNGKKFQDERTLQVINKCISLKDADMKKNNDILNSVLKGVLDALKRRDEFFQDHFQNLAFVGSYYKGTKVGKPEEFDINLIIKLPVKHDAIKFEKDLPGFTKLKLTGTDCFTQKWEKYRNIVSKWINPAGYLDQDKFRQWMEGLFTRTIPTLPQNDNYTLQVRKSGPAFTFCVRLSTEPVEMCVDLVPVLELHKKPPLPGNFTGDRWYAVPKPLNYGRDSNVNWRMSFYVHEKFMLVQHGRLKPVIRQVKKLRDTEDWKIIPSYHIETLFMHYIRDMATNPELEKLGGTKLFIHMLSRLKEACENRRLTNFWDNSHNLIDAGDSQLASIIGRLEKIIKQITEDPMTMADCVLTKKELIANEDELKAIRNSRDPGKSKNQPSTEGTETNWMQVGAGLASLVMNVSQIVEPVLRSGTNDSSSFRGTGSSNESAEIMHMLTLIRSDIADLRNSVDNLSRRIDVIQQRTQD